MIEMFELNDGLYYTYVCTRKSSEAGGEGASCVPSSSS